MSGMNRVFIVGHAGKDTEVRYTTNGDAVANFHIATSYKAKDRDEVVEWHRCVAFAKTAEVAGEYVTKGKLVGVEGRLQTRKWEKDGQDHYTTEIVVERLQLLGGRTDSGSQERPAAAANPAAEKKKADDLNDIPF